MITHFVTAEIDLTTLSKPLGTTLHQAVLTELQKHGEPLRWAVTSVDEDRQTAQVEAIVTIST